MAGARSMRLFRPLRLFLFRQVLWPSNAFLFNFTVILTCFLWPLLLSPSRRALAALSVTLLWFRLFHSGLGSLLDLLRALFADHTQGQRNRGKASDQGESQSGSFALIIVQPA